MAFHHAFNRRRVWKFYKSMQKGSDLSISLLAVAAYLCSHDATDDRDRLYGLTGLSTENHTLDINYSWSVDEVYLRFAQSFITQHKSLDIINFASLFVATPGSSLPSWVPDWRTRVKPLVVPLMASQSSNEFAGNLRPPRIIENGEKSTRYSVSGLRAAVYKFEDLTLLAHGCIIDAIDGLAGSRNLHLVQSSGQHSQRSDTAQSPKDNLTSVCRSLVLDREDRYLRYPTPLERFYSDFIHLCLLLVSRIQNHVNKEFQDWFWSTRELLIHGNSFESILCDVGKDNTDVLVRSVPNQNEYIQDCFYGRFFDTIVRMSLRLMTSCNGRIGMVPHKAIKGDLVCILFGCSVPVLLRKSGHKDQFVVVGECFLDNCMRGEALEQDEYLEKTFHII